MDLAAARVGVENEQPWQAVSGDVVASSRRSASACSNPSASVPARGSGHGTASASTSCAPWRRRGVLRIVRFLLARRRTGCAERVSRLQRREQLGEPVQAFKADRGRPKLHPGAIGGIKHPVRQLPAQLRTLIGEDALQLLAATERSHPHPAPHKRIPPVCDRPEAEIVCGMSVVGHDVHGTRRPAQRTDRVRDGPAPAPPGRRTPSSCRCGRSPAKHAPWPAQESSADQRRDHAPKHGGIDMAFEPPRVCRRHWVVSHVAISMLSTAA